jgi:CheY-like chemotaxis protein
MVERSNNPQPSAGGTAPTAFKDVVFLVIDDHAFVRHIVNEALKSFGAEQIVAAQDGFEALALLNQMSPKVDDSSLKNLLKDRPDIAGDLFPATADFTAEKSYCIITDFKMPGPNGLLVLKAIRCGQTKVPRHSPVILLTSFAEDFVVYAALQLDVNAFVVKPVSRNSLKEKIKRVLSAKFDLKSVKDYVDVDIPDEEGRVIEDEKMSRSPKKKQEMQDIEVEMVSIHGCPPGTVLADDLHSQSGSLLLRKGSMLTAAVIEKLKDAEEMKAFDGKIPVLKK